MVQERPGLSVTQLSEPSVAYAFQTGNNFQKLPLGDHFLRSLNIHLPMMNVIRYQV